MQRPPLFGPQAANFEVSIGVPPNGQVSPSPVFVFPATAIGGASQLAGAVLPISQTPVSLPSSGLMQGTQRSSVAQTLPSPRSSVSLYFATIGTHMLVQRPSLPDEAQVVGTFPA